MKLNKDLVREILLAIEESKNDPKEGINLVLKNRSPREISYHVLLLTEAGFILSRDAFPTHSTSNWQPTRLTYTGHEFLETVRDGEVWALTKTGVEKVGSGSLSLILEVGKVYGKQVLKDRLGIDLS